MLFCCAEHRFTVSGGSHLARQVEQLTGLFLGIAQRLQLPALACRELAGQGRHQQEEQQRQHVFFALDVQGKARRNEQKVIRQER
ncbi:peptidyl-prolyl cis-trans isomerase [Pseudomonas syringae pv. coryli]|uniref:Peptidyl-prolyl cis-trans isomerase n=1 Tax=Pseudomonas syringae pv. coryli TaxID=317659 RepID=A0A0P9PYH1_9PSED|nr:peptidyl-prolyl cis-trans isomerase [Pseudomonas syringae pv. coryli]